jgi:hypothetical protein
MEQLYEGKDAARRSWSSTGNGRSSDIISGGGDRRWHHRSLPAADDGRDYHRLMLSKLGGQRVRVYEDETAKGQVHALNYV